MKEYLHITIVANVHIMSTLNKVPYKEGITSTKVSQGSRETKNGCFYVKEWMGTLTMVPSL